MRKLNDLDTEFKNLAASRPGGENLKNCFLCGTCTAGCPVSSISSEYNPRKIMRMLLLGMKDELLSSRDIWLCSQCHTCVAHCPQNVRLADVIRVLREMAVEEGYVTAEFVSEAEKLEDEIKKDRIERIKSLKLEGDR